MGMPVKLEELVLEGKARALTTTLGLGGLSSFALTGVRRLVIWQVQIFPFIDLDTAAINAVGLDPTKASLMTARICHYFEFSTDAVRFGLAHRTSFKFPSGTVSQTLQLIPVVPDTNADLYSCYWVYDSPKHDDFLTMRVTRWLGANELGAVQTVDVPPRLEDGTTLPVAAASNNMRAQGGFGTIAAGALAWQPDARYPINANRTGIPRPVGSTADGTALLIPSALNTVASQTTYPLVNINYVLFNS